MSKVTTIGRKLGERIHVDGPCEFVVVKDPDGRKKLVWAIEHDEAVKVSRPEKHPNSDCQEVGESS